MIPTYTLPESEKYLHKLLVNGWRFQLDIDAAGCYRIVLVYNKAYSVNLIDHVQLITHRDQDAWVLFIMKTMESEVKDLLADKHKDKSG